MKKKSLLGVSLVAVIAMGVAVVSWAKVPPPPVNQNQYIYDTSFTNFTVENCRGCHGTDTQIATFHHALINTVTPPVSCINASGTVPPTLATGCHVLVPAPGGGFTFQDFRNCFNCHNSSPHHTSTAAAAQDCQHCHGSAIDNPNDGHYIPSYPASSVTPLPRGRVVTNPSTGQNVTVQGCAACHQADPSASPAIFSNQDTHHGTNIGNTAGGGVGSCTWCHNFSLPANAQIRACEACHGVKSLHNIQADTPAAANLGTFSPGNEDLGYSHIGNNWDCQGCHWSWFGNSAGNPFAGASIPFVKGLSASTVLVGRETNLVITGSGFTNTDGTTTYNPTVTLTAGGNTITLTPYSFTESEVKVHVPALQQGVYDLRVVKQDSNPQATITNLTKLTVVPEVKVASALLNTSTKTLTITGSGFGDQPPADVITTLGVYAGATQVQVSYWSNTKIVVTSPAFVANAPVTVKALYGAVSANITAAGKKERR